MILQAPAGKHRSHHSTAREVGRVVGIDIGEIADIDHMAGFTIDYIIDGVGRDGFLRGRFLFVRSPLKDLIAL